VPEEHDILATALAHVGGRVDARRAGIDLTFSAPKSVSLLFAFGNPTITEHVRSAHQAAIREALAYLEQFAGHGLRGHHGDGQTAQRISTNGFVAVAFEHRTSRTLGPQLHTHVVVANLVQGQDGQWSALDTRAVHRHARTAGFIYQAILRSELTHALGVSWTPVRKGQAEIIGAPSRALRWFSTRRGQIEDQLTTRGATGARAAQVACLDTRPAKERRDRAPGLRELWHIRAHEGRFDPTELVAKMLPQIRRGSQKERNPIDSRAFTRTLLSPDGLTQQQSTFDRTDVLRALCEAVAPTAPIDYDALGRLADHVLRNPDVVPVSSDPHGQARWTTREMLAVEGRALEVAQVLRDRSSPGVAQHLVEAAIEGRCLIGEQAALVRALTATTGTLHVVIGPAGSGKTASLAAANIAWQVAGHTVVGTSLSALAARNLQQGTGIRSTSLARLLGQLDRSSHPDRASAQRPVVLVVDEAGMVDTRTLTRILEHARTWRMTLVLMGDPNQLPEIGAGGLFTRLARHTTVELTKNRRQVAQWEQRALSALRSGEVPTALDAYYTHGRVHVTADYEQLQNALADDYLKWQTQHPQAGSVLVLAATRRHAQQLNEVIRRRLANSGHLTGPEVLWQWG
jgi:conjugative relaxase-like TrwC/TraI family protein